MKIWKYKGVNVHPAGPNSSGIRWWALTQDGQRRSDTKAGMRELMKRPKVTIHRFNPKGRPCKLGTMPALVIVDGRSNLAVGKRIRVRQCMDGSKWETVTVTRVEDDGYFFAMR